MISSDLFIWATDSMTSSKGTKRLLARWHTSDFFNAILWWHNMRAVNELLESIEWIDIDL